MTDIGTTVCKHGGSTAEPCYLCLLERNRQLEAENERLKQYKVYCEILDLNEEGLRANTALKNRIAELEFALEASEPNSPILRKERT